MNELGAQLLEYLNTGVDVLTAELPLFVDELITWKLTAYILGTVVSLLFTVFSGKMLYGLVRDYNEGKRLRAVAEIEYNEYEAEHGYKREKHRAMLNVGDIDGSYWKFVFIMPLILSLPFLFKSVSNLLQITIAPRIWLLEYAKDLIS